MANETGVGPASAHIKRAPRVEGRHEDIAVDSAGRSCAVFVVDISSGGFRLETEEPF